MEINDQAINKLAQEFVAGKRTLVLCGFSKIEDGFMVHPTLPEDQDILIQEDTISRTISVEEALQLMENPYCQNKSVLQKFLDKISALKK